MPAQKLPRCLLCFILVLQILSEHHFDIILLLTCLILYVLQSHMGTAERLCQMLTRVMSYAAGTQHSFANVSVKLHPQYFWGGQVA